MAGLGETLSGLWESFKGSPVGKFAQYEFAPESTMAPEDFVPATISDDGLPHYSQVEAGANTNRNGVPMSGLHSPLQNEIGAIGFSGTRVLDEMRNKGGKSFAMSDPAGVRSMGAKFQDPYGDLLSARVPASWINGLFAPQLPDTER